MKKIHGGITIISIILATTLAGCGSGGESDNGPGASIPGWHSLHSGELQ